MLFVQPREVTFGGEAWRDVLAVTVDRVATRTVREWDDTGPFLKFVDVPDRMVTVRVVQQLTRGDMGGVGPGSEGVLSLVTAPTAADANRRRVTLTGMVTGVTHELGRGGAQARGRSGGAVGAAGLSATRTITIVAISNNTQVDPVVVTSASDLQTG